MADDSNRVGTSPLSGTELLMQAMGIGKTAPASATAAIATPADSGAGSTRGGIGGPRGNRILPADFPLDQLDRKAARGTYLDILV